jgi:Fe-S oxidoreductase
LICEEESDMGEPEFREAVYSCLSCGSCTSSVDGLGAICPSGERFGFLAFYARGFAQIARMLVEGKLDWNRRVAEHFYTCSLCGACVRQCGSAYKDNILDVHRMVRRELVERGIVPSKVKDFLENIYKHGNPWGEPRRKRGEWSENTEIKRYKPGDEILYYVGCVASYDEIGKKIARTFGEILLKCGVSFGILGDEEECDGNEVNMLGEGGLFQLIAEKTLKNLEV